MASYGDRLNQAYGSIGWDDAKNKVANFNSRVLNALFSAVMNEEFNKISSTETSKEARAIL